MKPGINFIGIAVVYFCHDGKGNVLLAKRTNNCRDEHGRWDPGGGAIEVGEKIEEALYREIKEEYGTNIIRTEFLGFREILQDQQGQRTHWISFDFKVHVDRKKVQNLEPQKHNPLDWFRLDNLPEPMHSQWPVFLKLYGDKL